jgi:tetratricopeptide (TPR) repeat protein
VAAKALSKNKIAVTVPHIKHMLKLVEAVVQQIEVSVDDLTNSESKAELLALESVQVATDVKDKILGWLCAAKIHLNNSAKVDASKAVEYHLNALELLDSLPIETQKSGLMKISDFLQLGKLLIGMGRHKEALSSLLKGCALFTTASLFLLVGVCFMRLEQTQNAEEALMAANVLDNRNPDIWAYLCLHSLSFGKSRLNEADKSLQQALRLGLTNVSLFRELTTAYIAIDKLQVAEDLVRRALSQESKDFHLTGRRQSSHTRRLLGDVLAGQNQAVQAIEAYQAVIAVDDDLTSAGRVHKLEAAEKCAALLSSIGRDEELRTLRVIIASLRD